MLSRRSFPYVLVWLGAAAFSVRAEGQQDDIVTIRIRVDDSVRQSIPPLAQQNLAIEQDRSEEANELVRRSPPSRAVPIMVIIVGAIAVPIVLQMLREALRQVYYGGILIDMRSSPPSIANDPKIP